MFEFFLWCESTLIGTAVRDSIWAFPVIEGVHLLGLCLLGGSVLIVDLRLVGAGLTDQPIRAIQATVRPWLIGAVVTMGITGVLLFLSEAVKCYYNTSFWVKMVTLPIALAFTFLVRERVARRGEMVATTGMKWIGAGSMILWFVVAAAGRWIGYS